MKHKLQEDFEVIAAQIIKENKSLEEWARIESDDMFQEGNYIGGFDATEMEFCFSVYIEDKEYWFQLPVEAFLKIAGGEITEIEVKEAWS